MFQVMCQMCFAVKDLPTEVAPRYCPTCGSADCFVGPYVPESRITRSGLSESVPESPFYTAATALTDRSHFAPG
jgi:hypothetical protein